MVLSYDCHEIYEDIMMRIASIIIIIIIKHLRGDQLNVTVFSQKFFKPSNQAINNDRSLIY